MSHTRIFRGFEEKLSLVSIQTPKGMSVQIFKICLIFSYKNWEMPVGEAEWKQDQENLEKIVKGAAI